MNVPGRMWCSRPALYLGPYDEDGRPGLAGSGDFARRHMAEGNALIVRLVLTGPAILIVPTKGRNEPLPVPLPDVATIAVTYAGRMDSGVTITRRDGRVATFIVEPDDQLIGALQALGATVSETT